MDSPLTTEIFLIQNRCQVAALISVKTEANDDYLTKNFA